MFDPDFLAANATEILGPQLAQLNPLRVAGVLGGLQTLPALQANTLRLELLAAAVARTGAGTHALGRGRMAQLLNADLRGFARLEDPPEDAFLLPVLTDLGEFRIFEGVFEKNAVATECLLEALTHLLQEEPAVEHLLYEGYAVMSLSEAVAERARLGRIEYGTGTAAGEIFLPPSDRLAALGRRVQFTQPDLAAAMAPAPLLAPYVMDVRPTAEVRTPLRHRPILTDGSSFVVGAPSYLPAAWRRRVALEAQSASWGSRLAEQVVFAELRRFVESGFDDLPERILLTWRGPFVTTSLVRNHGPGRWVSVVVVGDGFEKADETGLDGMAPASDQIGAFLADAMASAEKFATDKPGFIAGAHLVVLCGWGRGLACALPRPGTGWTILHGPALDLATIGALGLKLDDLWRIEQQRDRLAQAGVHLANLNGTLNLVQYWRTTDNLLTPKAEDATPPLRIAVGTDYVLSARREGFERLGLRSLPSSERGAFERVRRKATSSWFGLPTALAQFAPMWTVMRGETVGVVAAEGAAPVWVTVPKTCGSLPHRVSMLDTALGWTERVVKALAAMGKGPDRVLQLTFQVPDEAAIAAYETAVRPDPLTVAESISVRMGELEATFELSEGWFGAWRDKANTAERALAERILAVVNRLSARAANAATIARLTTAVVPDDRARFQHALSAQAFYDLIQLQDCPRYWDLPESASALAKTGLVWDALGRDVFGRLPEAEVLPTIRATVQHLLNRVAARAGALDHESLLRRILRRHEGAVIDERRWMDTAGAALALAADRSEAEAVLRDRMWAGNAVRVGSRLLAEIVGSSPPDASPLDTSAAEKPEAGDVDVDELLADAVLALHMGDLHAEIENGVTPPEVVVALSGEVLSVQSFGEAVVRPIGARVADKRIRHEVRRYEKRVAEQEATPTVDHLFPADYSQALAAEFGLTLDGIRTIRDELEDFALGKGEAVFKLRRSELTAHLASTRGLPEAAVRACIERLTMPIRQAWAEPPPGFTRADIEPWRSGRRLAFFARPLIPLHPCADPDLLIAPGAFGLGMSWQFQRAFEGGLPEAFWSSPRMKAWSRDAAARGAAEFAREVGDRLETLGLEVQVEVLVSKVLNTKTPDTLGDIDVFAVDRTTNRAWVIEVKDLGLCRSQRETALRLTDYAGRVKSGGRPDSMLRHLRRVQFVREHAAALAKQNRLAEPVEVRGLLVVSTPQPMIVVEPDDADAQVVLLDDLKLAVEVKRS